MGLINRLINRLTIRVSCALVLFAFTVIMLAAGALGLYSNQLSRDAFGTLNQINVEQTQALNEAYVGMLRARVEMDRAAQLIRTPSFDRPDPVIEQAEALMAGAADDFQRFLDIQPQPEQIEAIDTLQSRFQSLLNTGLSLQLMVLKDRDIAGYASGQSRVSDMSQAFMQSADAFFEASAASGAALSNRFEHLATWLNRGMGAALLIALLCIVIVTWGINANVLRPLKRIMEHFRHIAEGDLSQPIETRENNEIGQLYSELSQMQASLAETVEHMRDNSTRVLESAHQMSEGNHELSVRTQQQAASLEQTAASLEELTANVASNADTARNANQLAQRTTHTANQGEEVMSAFVETMSDIHAHSQRIAEITGLIDTIAFQTNILALNASVEAARAGEHGRGFAVVANEVRALATRSGSAAHEIRGLLEASRTSVEQGSALSTHANDDMRSIAGLAQQVDALMAQIAQACTEQHQGIEQINQAMNQMEAVTQSNARLVESATLSARALEGDAEQMGAFAARFSTAGEPNDVLPDDPADEAEQAAPEIPSWQPSTWPVASPSRVVSTPVLEQAV